MPPVPETSNPAVFSHIFFAANFSVALAMVLIWAPGVLHALEQLVFAALPKSLSLT